MGSEVGGLSTSLGLYASPSLILSTDSVVVMEWKGMGTSTAASTASNRKGPLGLQSTCFCSSTPSPRLSRSKVSVVDLLRAPARCSIRPVHRSKLQVAVCSRDDASHGLFLMSPCRPGKTPESACCGFRSRRRPLELPYAPEPSYTAQPRAHGSKHHLNPSS